MYIRDSHNEYINLYSGDINDFYTKFCQKSREQSGV